MMVLVVYCLRWIEYSDGGLRDYCGQLSVMRGGYSGVEAVVRP